MDLGNLLSGLFGAIIAVLLAEVWRMVALRMDRSKRRKILKEYIKNIVVVGIKKYIEDTNKTTYLINNYLSDDTIYLQNSFDLLPTLNSNIFKEIGFNELYFLTKDYNMREKVIDIYHTIDYLMEEPAIKAHEQFINECDEHYVKVGIERLSEIIEHAKDCVTIQDKKSLACGNLNARKKAAEEALINCEKLLSYM